MTDPCRIIGVLDDGAEGLAPAALTHVREAGLVIGGERTLRLLAEQFRPETERRDLGGRLARVPDWIREARAAGRKVVVLATGDPLCHGIAAYLIGKLGRDACEVWPNLSTVQLACARLGRPWQGIGIASVHSRDAGEWFTGADPGHGLYPLRQALERHDELAVFTSPDNTPDRIARMLLMEGLQDQWRMAVAECLRQPQERIRDDMPIAEAARCTFADPNVVLLRRVAPRSTAPRFGLDDETYAQRRPDKGLITKREVRAVSLARMQLGPDSIVWDIGAGSGAVGLEAARLCPAGHVYAVEKNAEDVAIAERNRQRMQVFNHTLIHARAPQGLADWPDPDAVFIGGSGGELAELIGLCLQRLRPGGWLVMNFVTLENLARATTTLQALGSRWDVVQLQAARSAPILDMHRLQAENPVWIVSAQRGTS